MIRPRALFSPLACLALAACLQGPGGVSGSGGAGRDAPEGAAPGTCWDKTVTPAVVETVTEDVLVEPARMSPTGTVQSPPVYRSETRQRIVAPRRVDWTEVVCPDALRAEFVASVQRALAVRGHYAAPVTGQMTTATREAIRQYQEQNGLAGPVPGVLTIRAAQSLGLWAVPLSGG